MTAVPARVPVLVVGGGPSGLAVALELGRRGIEVLLVEPRTELDHHCGVFLDYDTPKPFHVHTVLRTPHGNDYGRAMVRQWRRTSAAQ